MMILATGLALSGIMLVILWAIAAPPRRRRGPTIVRIDPFRVR